MNLKYLLAAAYAWTVCPSLLGQDASGTAMDEPLRLMRAAKESYSQVQDYTCLFVKRERLRGQLQTENLIHMQARTSPFSVYMRWVKPKDAGGQEVCYVEGQNQGKMRARSPGLLGAVGFVSLDPNDPRAMESNRHAITESGIGNLIERFLERWDIERQLGKTEVRISDYEYDRRKCTRIETIHPIKPSSEYTYYRSVVYLDKNTRLPIRVENYDWPSPSGDAAGPLLESYSFADLKLNVGVPAGIFSK